MRAWQTRLDAWACRGFPVSVCCLRVRQGHPHSGERVQAFALIPLLTRVRTNAKPDTVTLGSPNSAKGRCGREEAVEQEVFPIASGIAIVVPTGRLTARRLRLTVLVVLSLLVGFVASLVSGELTLN